MRLSAPIWIPSRNTFRGQTLLVSMRQAESIFGLHGQVVRKVAIHNIIVFKGLHSYSNSTIRAMAAPTFTLCGVISSVILASIYSNLHALHRLLVHAVGLFSFAWVVGWYLSGALEIPDRYIILRSGTLGLIFLIASLACTPIRRLTGWSDATRLRRPLGLYGFVFVLLHFGVYALFENGLDTFSHLTRSGRTAGNADRNRCAPTLNSASRHLHARLAATVGQTLA